MIRNSIYLGISGQLGLARRMDLIAQNVANINSAGFKAAGVKFESVLSKLDFNGDPVSFLSSGTDYLNVKPGSLSKTSNPLDVAITSPSAWFSVETDQGVRYSRDGRMSINAEGQLVTVNGARYLDESGAPIQLNASAGTPVIKADGTIYQDGKPVAVMGLFSFVEGSKIQQAPNSCVIADRAPLPVDDRTKCKIVQGFIENSNVNGVVEMTNLISVSRAFEQMDALLRSEDEHQSEAIKVLGSISN